jgi:NAD(P)-dependent dehydrogenase (short-subunit alcohol dehydrogenase family)
MDNSAATMFDLTGQVALLTGAGRGIGLAMAQTLAAAGCSIALQDVDLAIAQQEAEAINKAGGRGAGGAKAIAFGGDIRDLSLPARLVSDVIHQFGRLDILVNNASIQSHTTWTESTAEQMREHLEADLISPVLLIQQVWPIFKQQRSGRIINIGSIQQRAVNPKMFSYSLSKGGLEKITRGLCRELAAHNVTINQIAPGWINTYRNRHQLTSPETMEQLGKKSVPLGRLGEPSDFRGIILLLCSPAGSYITGQTIFVDGGMSA